VLPAPSTKMRALFIDEAGKYHVPAIADGTGNA
jgi:hypothetical protein